jgi:hypothetical protein
MNSFVSVNGESFVVGSRGELSSMADSLKRSECGVDFDMYMHHRALEGEPFPYSSFGPASRTIENLWSGRRLCIYDSPTEVRARERWFLGINGTRVRFVPSRFGSFPFKWIRLVLKIPCKFKDSRQRSKHNGKKGTIIEFIESEGRFKVKLNDRKKNSFVAIKPENLETTVTSYTVNRMNIEVGGTLKREGSDHLISLEWIDPVEPAIDLDEGVLKALCPTCHSKEPPFCSLQ